MHEPTAPRPVRSLLTVGSSLCPYSGRVSRLVGPRAESLTRRSRPGNEGTKNRTPVGELPTQEKILTPVKITDGCPVLTPGFSVPLYYTLEEYGP